MKPIFQQGKIINPFAPRKATITIVLDLQTQQAEVKSDTALPLFVMAQTFLQVANSFVLQMAQAESMIVRGNKETETEKKGGENGEKESCDN